MFGVMERIFFSFSFTMNFIYKKAIITIEYFKLIQFVGPILQYYAGLEIIIFSI